ncbi:sensor histidine kinase [Synechocystis sp. PCC 7509]|uniref:sensor histidine kinase n=1 Tax=Synechocystis sp. PCC 7509 TaxID=927677 RepID=UPI0002ABB0FC|nr:sensor histidine kinase [Synechocystis sp. PCC 7509]
MRRFYFTSLRDRLILLILVCILPVLGMTLYNGIEDRRLAILQTRADMLKVSKIAATHQEQVLQNAQQLLFVLAKFTRVRTAKMNECGTLLKDVLKSYPIYNNIGVVTSKGQVVCSALPSITGVETIQDRHWWQQIVINRTFAVGKFPDSSSQNSIICAYPLFNEQNQVESAVFVVLDSSWLSQIVPKIPLPKGATLSIIDRHGSEIVRYPKPKDWQVKSTMNMPIIKDMLATGKNVAQIRGVDGSEHLYIPTQTTRFADPNRYMAAIGISQIDPFAQASRALNRNLLGLAIVTAIAITIAWISSELFWIRPLKKLVSATARIAAGDLTTRTNLPDRHEELSQLAQTFDYMAASLERQLTDLQRVEMEVRQLNQTLEQRVEERTVQLEFTNKELEAFSYSVSHDLRAPLRHIIGFVEALERGLEPTGALKNRQLAHYLSVINNSSYKMGLLIDGLLRLSRVGQKPLSTQKVNVRTLVDTAIALVVQHPDSLTIKFTITELPTVEGDSTLLQQVFSNLIDNAVKFSSFRHPPEINIGSLPDGTIFIRDNGIGFQMEYADKLFAAFQRLHPQPDFPGTGIGLAIVQRIIHRHRGKVWVESQPTLGTTFYIKI